ncbi:MAG: HD domain-containing phosphohydrolase [bacterium]
MKILIADDNKSDLELLEAILEPHGYEILKCFDGGSVLDILKREKVDLVISDVIMPGISGFDMVKKIKEEYEIPVVLLTSLGEEEDIIRGFKSGADEFLTKPILKEEMLLRINNLLKLKKYQNSLEKEVLKRTNELWEVLKDLKQLNKEVLSRLLLASEYRDDETGNHVIRVGKYSYIIAENMNFGTEFAESMEIATPMHDIGKIAVPDRILLKPGKLTPEEFEVIKQHSLIGASILQGSKFPLIMMAYEIALTHHEKWNGLGYPHGKKENEIPVSGRIAALSDILDALTTQRPYKPAFSWEKSVSIIKSESGKTFDPRVVNILFENIDDMYSVYNEFRYSKGKRGGYNGKKDFDYRR